MLNYDGGTKVHPDISTLGHMHAHKLKPLSSYTEIFRDWILLASRSMVRAPGIIQKQKIKIDRRYNT